MFIIKPYIFNNFPHIVSGVSTKIGPFNASPFYFNLSLNVGDDQEKVVKCRKAFFDELGFKNSEIAFQSQIHSDLITTVNSGGHFGNSDALITSRKNVLLVLTLADCTPILIYDYENEIIAAVHSGWRGAQNQILKKTLLKMNVEFNSRGENLLAYLGPSISQLNYEVGQDVAEMFDQKYVLEHDRNYFLDVASVNYDVLTDFGVKPYNIQKSGLCTFQINELLHSYRRDNHKSGRSLAVIGMRSF
jgi:YfiH family protein